ncbi:uncharacterized protein LOC109727329 isoform X2 [Ananas comosus]|nr:uncharacterized protein LOC109727329 isoform X2 [Ananas comosus]XP_020112993.1 uncharacterized protein LOC109727329 isoform X2 [Ananas comosus]XP_020112994.1 uncharacterized protein LOC109727329 isoform X2 [Ananas comosus]XP_020112995.1 uncharacterized protein LOC109727329 isoform X2 [Ananas comosus]OAY77851.1 hypothetical protein ACMD2_03205 [Ananas comosus]
MLGEEAMENSVEECELPTEECQWRQELEHHQSQVDALHDKFMEVEGNIKCSEEEAEKELEHLWHRVKAIATLLTYLKSKAKIMAVPHLAHTSCGIKHQQGIGFVDKNGIPLSDWSKDVDLSQFESSDDSLDGILKSVHLVTDVMESLVKRVIMAETEAASEKEKVKEGVEEIRRKSLQIDTMSARVEEMENFAQGTNSILNEMKQKVEDMVQETSRQRQRAAENEQELRRVKQDFESLRSYVSGLISVRETLLSSEKQIQTIEKLFDRLIAKTTHLENEKEQKEAEVQKLMEENVRLRAQLDKKEAQLLAMSEQCKFMALNNSNR